MSHGLENNITLAQLSQQKIFHEQAQFERRIAKIEEEFESRQSTSPDNRSKINHVSEDAPAAAVVATEGLTVIERLKKTRQKH